MFNKPAAAQLVSIPRLYQTEEIPVKDKLVYLHFFIGGSDWYIMEFDGKETFWGFVILNNDYEMAEFGYINYEDLKTIRVDGWQEIDYDRYWQVRTASQVKEISIAQGWTLPDHSQGVETECPSCINSVYQRGLHHGIHS